MLVGDCIIAEGMVSYSESFTMDFRLNLESLWNENTEKLKIIHSLHIKISRVLGDDVKIRI